LLGVAVAAAVAVAVTAAVAAAPFTAAVGAGSNMYGHGRVGVCVIQKLHLVPIFYFQLSY